MFFTATLVSTIVEQTNIYAQQVLGQNRPWRAVTVEDIWVFFKFCILNRLPALRHYWSNDPHFHYRPVAGYITRQRFGDLEVSTLHRQQCRPVRSQQWCNLITYWQ